MPFSRDRASDSLASASPGLYRLWLFCICAGMLLFFTQVTVLFPVLPVYVIQRWGENAPVGLVVGAMACGLLCFRPLIGWLIDRWGRKPVLWLGLLIMVGILPLYQWSPDPGVLMGVRVLHGISQAAFATASQTLLADLVPPERRTALMGYLAMSNTIGFSLGPLLGSITATVSFTAVLLLMAALTGLGVLISLPLPWQTGAKPSRDRADSVHPSLWSHVFKFPVRDATLIFFVGSFLHGGVVTFLPLFIGNSALFYSLNALTAVAVRFGVGRWGQHVSQQWLISIAIFCSGGALIGLAQLPDYLILWSVIYGLGFGTLFPVLSAIVSLSAPTSVRGRVYSFFLAGFDAGMTLGGAGLQPLVSVLSLGPLFAGLGVAGCGISVVAFQRFAETLKDKG